jgi:FKBP-type peptidyl-prolyl cis-trans isomerase FklB
MDGAVGNWQVRNEHYIDSIADVARANLGEEVGKWKIYRNYKIANESTTPGLGGTIVTNPYETLASASDSVYMRIIEVGKEEGLTPLFTDSVSVYYRGKLINGTVFDQNYTGDLDEKIHVPTHFALQANQTDGLIVGWITALQWMKEGERVELYIPAALGYGTQNQSSIPANSVLIFDLKLEKVIHPDGIESYSLKVD